MIPFFEVIFITAFNQYAAKAFRTSAVDYLLKPVDLEEMREALNKVKEKLEYRKLKIVRVTLQIMERLIMVQIIMVL